MIEMGILTTQPRYLVATTTIWSGLSYIYTKDAVKIVGQQDPMKKDQEQKRKQEAEQQSEKKQWIENSWMDEWFV